MHIGQVIKTSLGDVTVLEENKIGNYLILFTGDKFIKANRYFETDKGYIAWENGEYYNSLHDFMVALDRHSDCMEKATKKAIK